MGIEELKNVLIQIDTDINNISIGKEQLEDDIEEYENNNLSEIGFIKKLKELRNGMKVYLDILEESLDDLDDEIVRKQKEIMLENLK